MNKENKDHIKITGSARKGYLLTIFDPDFSNIECTWAVTEAELYELHEKLNKKFRGEVNNNE